MFRAPLSTAILSFLFYAAMPSTGWAEEELAIVEGDGKPPKEFEQLPALSGDWKLLTKKDSPQKVWVNGKQKEIAVAGRVCLTRGYLEMFACVANTKEHESVVALMSKAQLLHAGLIAVGAKPGHPARWRPYRPASGTVIDVYVEWMAEGKRKRIKAQEWVRDLKTMKAMAHDWVFAGSSIYEDPETKKRFYRADSGEVICVSNFPVAMMDIPIESSQSDAELAFEAYTEHIPPRGTPVRVYLKPKLPKPKTKSPKPPTKSDTAGAS